MGLSIIFGNFNAKNVAWNCDMLDDAGMKLLDIVERNLLDIINFNSKSHINVRNNSFNNLDLIFSESKITNMIDFHQEENPMGSI